jgi:hypothetical protein
MEIYHQAKKDLLSLVEEVLVEWMETVWSIASSNGMMVVIKECDVVVSNFLRK